MRESHHTHRVAHIGLNMKHREGGWRDETGSWVVVLNEWRVEVGRGQGEIRLLEFLPFPPPPTRSFSSSEKVFQCAKL